MTEREVRDDDAYDVHAYDDVLPSRRAFFYIIDTWIIRYLLLKEVRQNFLFLAYTYDVHFDRYKYKESANVIVFCNEEFTSYTHSLF